MKKRRPTLRANSRYSVSLPRPTRKETLAILGIAVIGIVGSFTLERVVGPALPGDPRQLQQWLQSTGPIAPIAFIALMILAIVVPPIPSIPLDLAAGLTFGIFWGTVYTVVGAEFGGLIAFALSRRFGRPWLARHLSAKSLSWIDRTSDRLGIVGLMLMRFLPVFDFDWVSYAAGLTPMPARHYALATLIGMIIPVVGIVSVGHFLLINGRVAALIFSALLILYVVPPLWWLVRPSVDATDRGVA